MEHEIEQQIEPVPYLVHESDMARAERKNRRLWITLTVLIAAIVAYGAFNEATKRNLN